MIRTCVARPVGVSMCALAVALLGVVACLRLPVDLLPSLELPRLSVQIRMEDASAAELEQLVTIPVEQALSGVPGVQEVASVSRDEVAVITVAFPWMTNLNLAVLNVRERLDEVRYVLPETAAPPTVRRWDPGNRPFMVLAVSRADLVGTTGEDEVNRTSANANTVGPTRPGSAETWESSRLVALSKAIREILAPRLEQIPGVANAALIGDREEHVLVELHASRARLLDVAPAEVSDAIRRAVTVPAGGTLRKGPYRYSVRVPALIESPADFGRIIVSVPGATPRIRLDDVARVSVVPSEPVTVLRFEGAPAVGLRLFKDTSSNALALTDTVTAVLDEFRTEYPDLRLEVAYAQAGFIRAALAGALGAVALGAVLAFGVLVLFLGDWRQPAVIGIVVPVSVLGALAAMDGLSVSINIISLGGLALGIGLLVNTAIIVVENIHRHRERGLSPAAAAVTGTTRVVAPITSVTLTTMVVFLPVVAVGGFAGALFHDQAVTVSVAVLVAWAASLTLVPALSVLFAGRRVVRPPQEPWTPVLRRLLRFLLFRRRLVLLAAAVLGAATVILGLRTPREVAPSVDTGEVSVTAAPRHDMPIERLVLAAVRTEQTLSSTRSIERLLTTAGLQAETDLTGDGAPGRSDVRAQFHLSRRTAAAALAPALAQELPGFEVRVEPTETPLHDVLGMLDGPVDVVFSGSDLAGLRSLADEFAALVGGRSDLGRLVAAPPEPEPRLRLDLDQNALGALGLSPVEIAAQVGYATRGETVAQLPVAEPPLRVVLRHTLEDGAGGAPALDRIPIVPPRDLAEVDGDGEAARAPRVPLALLATPVTEATASAIARRDHRRALVVSVAPDGLGRAGLESRLGDVVERLSLPPDVRVEVRTRTAAAGESLASLRWVLVIVMVLVVICLSAEFESIRLALVVLLSVPLTLSGVVATWWVFGLTMNVFTVMAATVLIGIGVDDAIILVDFMRVKHREAKAADARPAIIEAALLRVRPILMTTVTTVLAVAPLALTTAPAQELQRALALTLIGGLLTGTVLSVCFVPVVYELLAPDPRRDLTHARHA